MIAVPPLVAQTQSVLGKLYSVFDSYRSLRGTMAGLTTTLDAILDLLKDRDKLEKVRNSRIEKNLHDTITSIEADLDHLLAFSGTGHGKAYLLVGSFFNKGAAGAINGIKGKAANLQNVLQLLQLDILQRNAEEARLAQLELKQLVALRRREFDIDSALKPAVAAQKLWLHMIEESSPLLEVLRKATSYRAPLFGVQEFWASRFGNNVSSVPTDEMLNALWSLHSSSSASRRRQRPAFRQVLRQCLSAGTDGRIDLNEFLDFLLAFGPLPLAVARVEALVDKTTSAPMEWWSGDLYAETVQEVVKCQPESRLQIHLGEVSGTFSLAWQAAVWTKQQHTPTGEDKPPEESVILAGTAYNVGSAGIILDEATRGLLRQPRVSYSNLKSFVDALDDSSMRYKTTDGL